MKKLHSLILFLSISLTAMAQVPPAYQGDFNRMMAGSAARMAQQQMSMQQQMNYRWYFDSNSNMVFNSKYTFMLIMKDNSQLEVDSKIYTDTATHKSYVIYIDKKFKRSDPNRDRKIYADQTLKISRTGITEEQTTYTVTGMPTDSCWLFLVGSGKINVYSHLSQTVDLNNLYLRAFQVGSGPVQKIDSASLFSVIKDNPKAVKAFNKKDYYTAIEKYNSK